VEIAITRPAPEPAELVLYQGDTRIEENLSVVVPTAGAARVAVTCKVLDQYGGEMPTDGSRLSWRYETEPDPLRGVRVSGGIITVESSAATGVVKLTAVYGETDPLERTVSVSISGLWVIWPEMVEKEKPVYGDRWAQIVTIGSGGAASIGGTAVPGVFTLKDAGRYPKAGDSAYTVYFQSDDGKYRVGKDYYLANAVERKAIAILGVRGVSRPYNQDTRVELTGGTLSGVLTGDQVEAVVPASGRVELPGVGTNKAVTLDEITLTGEDADNYRLIQPSVAATIEKALVTSIQPDFVADRTIRAEGLNGMEDVIAAIGVQKVNASFGDGLTEETGLSWSTKDVFRPGADQTYTFIAALKSEQLRYTGSLTTRVTVTQKLPVGVVVRVPADTVYGIPVADPTATQVDAGYGLASDGAWRFTYEGAGGTEYGPSEEKPLLPGYYRVIATLLSDSHAGTADSGSEWFAIAKKPVTVRADDKTMDYGGPVPALTWTMVDGALAYDDTPAVIEVRLHTEADRWAEVSDSPVAITGTAKAERYEVSVEPGGLSISPKDSASLPAPTIEGKNQLGATVRARLEGWEDASGLAFRWYLDGREMEGGRDGSLTLGRETANKPITAIAAPDGASRNFSGAGTGHSAPFQVAKGEIAGTPGYKVDHSGGSDAAVLDAGDVVTLLLEKMEMIPPDGKGLEIHWYLDGTRIAEGERYVVAEEAVGTLWAVMTATGDFTGSVRVDIGEIGKRALTGALSIEGYRPEEAPAGQRLTAVFSTDAGKEDYAFYWLRNGVNVATGESYTLTEADRGAVLTLEARAEGEQYTGKLAVTLAVPAGEPQVIVVLSTADGRVSVSYRALLNGGKSEEYWISLRDAGGNLVKGPLYRESAGNESFTGLTNGETYTVEVLLDSEGGSDRFVGTVMPQATTAPPAGGGGGGDFGVPTYGITVDAGVGGGIRPDSCTVEEGGSLTFAIEPEDGYVIGKVWVDGREIGPVESYTFENVSASHTLSATFVHIGDMEILADFIDVSPDRWSWTYIHYLAAQGIVEGVGDGAFAPERAVTRAEFVKMLAGMAGAELGEFEGRSDFADVAPDSWYAGSVAWARDTGVTQGVSDTVFRPNDPITREQMAAMIRRFAEQMAMELPLVREAIAFSDEDQFSDWAREPVAFLQRAGLLDGVGDGRFDPAGAVTREQAAKVLALLHQAVYAGA